GRPRCRLTRGWSGRAGERVVRTGGCVIRRVGGVFGKANHPRVNPFNASRVSSSFARLVYPVVAPARPQGLAYCPLSPGARRSKLPARPIAPHRLAQTRAESSGTERHSTAAR